MRKIEKCHRDEVAGIIILSVILLIISILVFQMFERLESELGQLQIILTLVIIIGDFIPLILFFIDKLGRPCPD